VLKTAARVKPTFLFMNAATIEQKHSYKDVLKANIPF